MAEFKNTTIDDTGFLELPSGTTAQRPSSPQAGMVRYNTDDEIVEVYNGTEWTSLVIPLGSAGNPALSPDAIIQAGADDGDGTYFYALDDGSIQELYTNFSYDDPKHGRGWILAGRVDGDSTTFNIQSSNWTNTNTFGSTLTDDSTSDMKNLGWIAYSSNVLATQFQLGAPDSQTNWFNFTHNLNLPLNDIFDYDNVSNGFITFDEQFDTSGSINSNLTDYFDKIGFPNSERQGSPTGRLGLNSFMDSDNGPRRNADQQTDGGIVVGTRIGFLGDGSTSGNVWPGQAGGVDDYFVGVAGNSCRDGGNCDTSVDFTVAGHYRMSGADAGSDGSWFTRCNIWVK